MNAASLGFTDIDLVALLFFLAAWGGYHLAVERLGPARRSLNTRMAGQRRAWMRQLLARENRIVDSTIMASLQSGAAFFASTALLAVGAVLALIQATETALALFADLPFGVTTTRLAFEAKVFGLGVIFVYAFFKFAWSYRLFNYAAILLGAIPQDTSSPDAEPAAMRAAQMTIVAGRHFNRGQRAFFFALGYLGWFVGPWVLIVATAAVLIVMARRQFGSDAIDALDRTDATP
ncbi:DUF599 domain-containing protein [Salinarimonas ramus]|uniref:Membrane protein n=1 Tax=Salinarimonas ramus TaxID=690164 RepID=A0A917QC16_9HYPH|nr:DUF599 family protein [Salinarimonas ramus]GGK43089.1 membrane protein [Salinarimonas ramus]